MRFTPQHSEGQSFFAIYLNNIFAFTLRIGVGVNIVRFHVFDGPDSPGFDSRIRKQRFLCFFAVFASLEKAKA